MALVVTRVGGPSPIVDPSSIDRTNGVQIDWANVSTTNADGKKTLPAFTVVGTLLGSGKASPRVATTNPAVGMLATSAVEGDPTAALSGYGLIVGGVINENLLPDATGTPRVLASAVKTELTSAGTGWTWKQYSDGRAS